MPILATTEEGRAVAPSAFRRRVASYAENVKRAIRRGRANTRTSQSETYVANLAKDALCRDRSMCVEQTTALVADIAARGAELDAEKVGRELITVARVEADLAHPHPKQRFADAHMAEQAAQGKRELAEAALTHATPSTLPALSQQYLDASAEYELTVERMDLIVAEGGAL